MTSVATQLPTDVTSYVGAHSFDGTNSNKGSVSASHARRLQNLAPSLSKDEQEQITSLVEEITEIGGSERRQVTDYLLGTALDNVEGRTGTAPSSEVVESIVDWKNGDGARFDRAMDVGNQLIELGNRVRNRQGSNTTIVASSQAPTEVQSLPQLESEGNTERAVVLAGPAQLQPSAGSELVTVPDSDVASWDSAGSMSGSNANTAVARTVSHWPLITHPIAASQQLIPSQFGTQQSLMPYKSPALPAYTASAPTSTVGRSSFAPTSARRVTFNDTPLLGPPFGAGGSLAAGHGLGSIQDDLHSQFPAGVPIFTAGDSRFRHTLNEHQRNLSLMAGRDSQTVNSEWVSKDGNTHIKSSMTEGHTADGGIFRSQITVSKF